MSLRRGKVLERGLLLAGKGGGRRARKERKRRRRGERGDWGEKEERTRIAG